jgi:hypothetical protein
MNLVQEKLPVDPLKVLKDPLRESMPNTVIANTVLREATDLNVDGTSRAIQPQHFTAHYSPNAGTQEHGGKVHSAKKILLPCFARKVEVQECSAARCRRPKELTKDAKEVQNVAESPKS